MSIVTTLIEYSSNGLSCQGVVAYDDGSSSKRPLVLVAHDWSGRNAFAEEKAHYLASLGYIGFAIDMYGHGRLGQTNEEKSALMQPLMQDRAVLLARIKAAYDAGCALPLVDATKTGAIGFCFGGLCVLDLARSGTPLSGVVSVHGLLTPPLPRASVDVRAKVLALHGYDDPMVTGNTVLAFADEMTAAKADWQIHMYGHTMHAFTNPLAHDVNLGLVYNERAKKRAFESMSHFFREIF